MNTSKQLEYFLKRAAKDERLLPSHISLYIALISVWQKSRFSDIFKIFRKELMHLAHINSFATYHKCIKQLDDFGYVKYQASYNYYQGCLVQLCR